MTKDLRKYAKQTNFRLIVGTIIILFVVGLGLIAIFYGLNAALLGLICLLGAFIPIGLIVLLLFGLDRLVNRINRN